MPVFSSDEVPEFKDSYNQTGLTFRWVPRLAGRSQKPP